MVGHETVGEGIGYGLDEVLIPLQEIPVIFLRAKQVFKTVGMGIKVIGFTGLHGLKEYLDICGSFPGDRPSRSCCLRLETLMVLVI